LPSDMRAAQGTQRTRLIHRPCGTSLRRSAESTFSPYSFLWDFRRVTLHLSVRGNDCRCLLGRAERSSPKAAKRCVEDAGLDGERAHRAIIASAVMCILTCFHQAAAAASGLVQRKSVPSTHMRCRTTASRRATATIARFIPRCRAIFMPHALSQDHFRVQTIRAKAASNNMARIIRSPHFETAPIRSVSPDWY
jgi:hypothetical protein